MKIGLAERILYYELAIDDDIGQLQKLCHDFGEPVAKLVTASGDC
jgi:hypothetical protein